MNYVRFSLFLGICIVLVMGRDETCHLSCSGEYDLMTDPMDCSGFYMCGKKNIVGPFLCPESRPFFNGVHCTKEKSSCCHHSCLPYCAHEGLEVGDPLDCRSFYICQEEGLPSEDLHFRCDRGKVYDAKVGHCVFGKQCYDVCSQEEAAVVNKAVDEQISFSTMDFDISDGDIFDIAKLVEEALFLGRRVHKPKRG